MERVGVLINKLQEQLTQNADVQKMLVTVQLLHSELLFLTNERGETNTSKVTVMVPGAVNVAPVVREEYKPVPKQEPEPEPVVEPATEPSQPIPEPEPHPTPKPEPIPHFSEGNKWAEIYTKKENTNSYQPSPITETAKPVITDKVVYELNDIMVSDQNSMNDKLKEGKAEVGSYMQEAPIRDLKKAININERHRFIHDLFRNDESMYERSIKTINSFNIYAEAEYWIQRELKVKLGWISSDETVRIFDQLVKRRFS